MHKKAASSVLSELRSKTVVRSMPALEANLSFTTDGPDHHNHLRGPYRSYYHLSKKEMVQTGELET